MKLSELTKIQVIKGLRRRLRPDDNLLEGNKSKIVTSDTIFRRIRVYCPLVYQYIVPQTLVRY